MTEIATRSRAKSTPAATAGKILEVEVGRGGKNLIDKLANARIARLMAEQTEKPLKDAVKELWLEDAEALELGDTLLVKAMGVVRGRVTLRHRAKTVDLDLLLTAFPEAYEKCVSDNVSPQFDAV